MTVYFKLVQESFCMTQYIYMTLKNSNFVTVGI